MAERFTVIWTPTAERDLVDIIRYIAAENARNAKRVALRLKQRVQKLDRYPKRGRYVPELRNINIYLYRELIISPWRIIYRIEKQVVYVLAVLDSRRDLESILLERFVREK